MKIKILLIILFSGPMLAVANMSETECNKLQSDIYKYAASADPNSMDSVRKLYELSTKLTEECGYLMDPDTLKQRRLFNDILSGRLNSQ